MPPLKTTLDANRQVKLLSDRATVVLNLHIRSIYRNHRWTPRCRECGNEYPCLTRKVLLGQRDTKLLDRNFDRD